MLKENRTVVLARVESTYGVDAIAGNLPAAFATDALLCSALDVAANAESLDRANYSPSLSKDTSEVGRVLGQFTFTTELRASGTLGVAPRIGRLFKASNMAETIIAAGAASQISDPVAGPTNASAAIAGVISGLTKTTAPSSHFDTYRVTFTTGGAPGTAKYIVTGAGFPNNETTLMHSLEHKAVTNSLQGTVTVGGTLAAPTFTIGGTFANLEFIEIFVGGIRFYHQVVTGQTNAQIATALDTLVSADTRFATSSAATNVLTIDLSVAADEITTAAAATQSITLGDSGAVIELPIISGNITAGESFEVSLLRNGVYYTPVSDDGSSLTLWAFLDGNLYRLRGARGTWSAQGQGGQYATVQWTFTGLYTDPIDYALPTTAQGLAFETSKPYKVELAQLAVYGMQAVAACASRFAFDMANEVNPNDCINADEAFDRVMITGRTPTAGADPETVKPSEYNPWARLRRGDTSRIHVSVGARGGAGNIVRLQADRTNYTGAAFTARQGIRAHDLQFRLARKTAAGDDELSVFFG